MSNTAKNSCSFVFLCGYKIPNVTLSSVIHQTRLGRRVNQARTERDFSDTFCKDDMGTPLPKNEIFTKLQYRLRS